MDKQTASPADIEIKRLQARIRALEEQLHEQKLKDTHLRAPETDEPRQQGDCLRQLIEHSSDALVVIDAGGHLRYVSPAAEKITGFSIADLEGRAIDTLVHPDDLTTVLAAWDETIAHPEKPVTVRYRHIHKTRQWVHSEAVAQSFLTDASINGVLVSVRDITGQIHTEQQMHRHEQTLEAVFNTITESIHLITPEGTILMANDAMAQRFATTVDQLIGRNVFDLFPPETRRRRKQHLEQVVASGHPLTLIDQRLEYTFETHIWPIVDANGIVERVVIFSRDVSKRMQAERALTNSRNLLNTTQRLARIGGWEWDVEAQTMTWTDTTYHIHGLQAEDQAAASADLVGKSLACYHPEDRPVIHAAFQRCLATGEPYDLRLRLRPVEGDRLWVRTMAESVWKDGQVALVRGNIIDISSEQEIHDLLQARLRLSEAAATLSVDELLTMVLDEAEALTGSLIGFFHFVDPDEQTLSLQAWSRSTTTHFCRAEGKGMHYPVEQAGVWADCIRQRRAVFHNDYEVLPHRKGLPPGHASVIRELVVPIFREERIVAVFGVGNKEQPYGDRDIHLVTSLGDMAWDIILRKQAEILLKAQADFTRRVLDSTDAHIAILDRSGTIIDVNAAWVQFACANQGKATNKLGKGASYFCQWLPEAGDTTNAAEAFAGIHQVITGERDIFEIDYPCHAPSQERWFNLRAMPIKGSDGQVLVSHTNITALKQTQESLTTALAEKDILLREVHHRVKNNLAAIISLLDLQRRLLRDDIGRDVLVELASRIRSMSLIHEKLYRSSDLAHIQFQGYLQALISHLRTSFGSPSIRCQVEAEGVDLPLDLAVPCGMIVNELVTNAMKYAFPNLRNKDRNKSNACSINITMRQTDASYTLKVADNGVGLPEDYDWTNAKTLGMTLVRMLGCHQLCGCLTLANDRGLQATLTFTTRRGRS